MVEGDSRFQSFEYLITSTSQPSTLDLLTLMGGADANHRFAQVGGDFRQDLGVVVVGNGLDDSSCALGRVS